MPDTKSIIAASIADIRQDSPADGGPDASDSVADTTVETPEADAVADPDPADAPDPDPTEKPTEKPADDKKLEDKVVDNDDVAKEPEFTVDKNGRKTVNRIPQPRVTKMVEASVKRAIEARDKEHATRTGEMETRIKHYDSIGEIMERDPDRFMAMLAETMPAYREFAKGGAKPAVAKDAGADDPMPKPDSFLPDGVTPAYSPEAFEKVQQWQARLTEKSVLAKVDEKYGFVQKDRDARDAHDKQVSDIRQQIAEAHEWEGFKDHQAEILKALQDDSTEAERTGGRPKLKDLAAAYRHVLSTKHQTQVETLKVDRNKMREELLAELKGRPNGTATVPTTPVVKRDPAAVDDSKPRDTRDIIRDSIASLKR